MNSETFRNLPFDPARHHETLKRRYPHYVYRAFDVDDNLLYVGCTRSPLRRQDEHRRNASWWLLVARWEVQECTDYYAAREAEQVAIVTEKPMFNVSPDEVARRRAAGRTATEAAS